MSSYKGNPWFPLNPSFFSLWIGLGMFFFNFYMWLIKKNLTNL